MARWEPNAADRLVAAAVELYSERGFENTTVAEIAARAGLTERTFFRHFADKREVLFQGSERLAAQLVSETRAAPASTPPLDAVTAGLESLAGFFDSRRAFSERRRAVVAASRDLQERELIKRASLVAGVAAALRERGVAAAEAVLTAELGIAAFHIAYDRWADDPQRRGYDAHVRATVAELRRALQPEPAAQAPV